MSFEDAVANIQEIAAKVTALDSKEEKLEIYALFKQGELGDNTTARPGGFDLKGKYKWDAWKAKEG